MQAKCRFTAFLIWLLAASWLLVSCGSTSPEQVTLADHSAVTQLSKRLYDSYADYQEPALTHRRFKHDDIEGLLKQLPSSMQLQEVGRSVENRSIYRLSWGRGPTDVLLWSQMHGDEPTATAALFDIFGWLQGEGDGFDSLRQQLAAELTLVFLPMLNPDGADRFQRRNAWGIDLNRDALRLSAPESRILKQERDRLDADWGFNLHDQSRYYSAGYPSDQVATLSFLAPAYNFEKEVNAGRLRAMQAIALMDYALQPFIPGQIARYNDDFEPRAFGDNIQKWGTSTILIESGGHPNDREKQQIRRLNFVALLTAFAAIADGSFAQFTEADYDKIPFNESNVFYDLLVRNASVKDDTATYLLDIGYRSNEIDFAGNRRFYFRSAINDLGDLSTFRGYEEIDTRGLRLQVGKRYPEPVTAAALRQLDARRLHEQGFTAVEVSDWSPQLAAEYRDLHLLQSGQRLDRNILPGLNPDLLFFEGDSLKYRVINGQLID